MNIEHRSDKLGILVEDAYVSNIEFTFRFSCACVCVGGDICCVTCWAKCSQGMLLICCFRRYMQLNLQRNKSSRPVQSYVIANWRKTEDYVRLALVDVFLNRITFVRNGKGYQNKRLNSL